MKTYKLLLTFLVIFSGFAGKSQLSGYQFTSGNQPFTSISNSGNAVFPQGSSNNTGQQIPIGFNFKFNGVDYQQLMVAENGFVFFGTSSAFFNSDLPISTSFFNSGTFHGVASAFGTLLHEQIFGLSSAVYYKTSGTAPNRTFEVEWKNYSRVSALVNNEEDAINFKIILNETSNVIRFHYGTVQLAQSVTQTDSVEVGLRGISNQDFKSLTHSWSAPQNAISAIKDLKLNFSQNPQSGLMYTFTPANTSGNLSLNLNQNLSGQVFTSGQTLQIQFHSTLATQVKISFINTKTASAKVLQASFSAQQGNNVFTWNTPSNMNVTSGKIRIESVQQPGVFDQSQQTLAIVRPNQIKVLTPNGNQQFTPGQIVPITWAPTALTRLDIDYTLNGTEYFPIAKKVAGSAGLYNWKVPNVLQTSSNARIRISKANDVIIHDVSDNNFTIQTANSSFIEILSPNGGEVYTAGSIISIKFANPQVQAPIKLWYKTRPTGQWIAGPTYTSSVQTPTISFVAPHVKSGKFMIKLENTLNPGIFDTCSAYLKIVLPRNINTENELQPEVEQNIDELPTEVQIFPNPAVNEIQVKHLNEFEKVYVINRMGFREIAKPEENKINITHLPAGYYHLILINEKENRRISKGFYKH